MQPAAKKTFAFPAVYRKMENMHILFWLFKDISWCMEWKVLGMFMIAPTLAIALVIARRTRHIKSEWAHNLAIILWIVANSYWMISEFFGFDETAFWLGIHYRYLAVIPFVAGLLILLNYYLLQGGLKENLEELDNPTPTLP